MLLKHFHQFNSKIFCSSNSTKICPSMRSKIQGVSFLPGNGTSQNKVLGSTVLQFVCLSQITHALQAVQEKFSSPTTVCNNKFFPSFPPHGDCDLQLWDSSPKVESQNPKVKCLPTFDTCRQSSIHQDAQCFNSSSIYISQTFNEVFGRSSKVKKLHLKYKITEALQSAHLYVNTH